MRDAAAIIAPSVDIDQLARSILKKHIAIQDGEKQLASAEQKTESLRQEQARRRVEIGRDLIEAKGAIKHGGWLPYLEKLGIGDQSARDWMRLAGWVEGSKSQPSTNGLDLAIPTRREVNEARKRDEQPDPAPVLDDWTREVEKRRTAVNAAADSLVDDIGKLRDRANRWLSEVQDKGESLAASAPPDLRQQMAHELNDLARRIKEMK